MSVTNASLWKRAGLLLLVAVAFVLPVLLAGCKAAPKELNVLSWEGYSDPEWVQGFEKAHNVKVNVTYIGSDDELFAKLRGGSGETYDVVATMSPTSSRCGTAT